MTAATVARPSLDLLKPLDGRVEASKAPSSSQAATNTIQVVKNKLGLIEISKDALLAAADAGGGEQDGDDDTSDSDNDDDQDSGSDIDLTCREPPLEGGASSGSSPEAPQQQQQASGAVAQALFLCALRPKRKMFAFSRAHSHAFD